MTVLTENVANIAGIDSTTTIVLAVPDLRGNLEGDGIVTVTRTAYHPNADGVLTTDDLEPGIADVIIGHSTYRILIPDSLVPVRLWPLIEADLPVTPDTDGWGAATVRAGGTAAAALGGHRVVTRRADGLVDYASNTTPAHADAALWITTSAAASGTTLSAVAFGEITEPTWSWTPLEPVFLGAAGVLTQVAPTSPAVFLARVAVATSATSMFVQTHPSILLV